MKSLQFTFLLLGVLCLSSFVANTDVKFKGQNVTIKCHNVDERVMGVSLYTRHEAEMEVLFYDVKSKKINLKSSYEGRVKAKFDTNTLTVDILNLQMKDTGAYWCTCSVFLKPDCSVQSGVILVVRDQEMERKAEQAAPKSVGINGLLVPVVALSASSVLLLLLLVLGVWIMPKIKKMRNIAEQEKRSANEVYEVMTVKR